MLYIHYTPERILCTRQMPTPSEAAAKSRECDRHIPMRRGATPIPMGRDAAATMPTYVESQRDRLMPSGSCPTVLRSMAGPPAR